MGRLTNSKLIELNNAEHKHGIHTSYVGLGDKTKAGHREITTGQPFLRGKALRDNIPAERLAELKRLKQV